MWKCRPVILVMWHNKFLRDVTKLDMGGLIIYSTRIELYPQVGWKNLLHLQNNCLFLRAFNCLVKNYNNKYLTSDE
jgi:hypothetical protein